VPTKGRSLPLHTRFARIGIFLGMFPPLPVSRRLQKKFEQNWSRTYRGDAQGAPEHDGVDRASGGQKVFTKQVLGTPGTPIWCENCRKITGRGTLDPGRPPWGGRGVVRPPGDNRLVILPSLVEIGRALSERIPDRQATKQPNQQTFSFAYIHIRRCVNQIVRYCQAWVCYLLLFVDCKVGNYG
jgi:hypothetical protein